MSTRKLVLQLELHVSVTGDSLTGALTADDGRVTEFAGWLALIAAIDAAVAEPADTPTT